MPGTACCQLTQEFWVGGAASCHCRIQAEALSLHCAKRLLTCLHCAKRLLVQLDSNLRPCFLPVLQIGFPVVKADATLEFGAVQTFTTTTTNTDMRTSTYTAALQEQIPGLTLQTVNATLQAVSITVRVPVNVKTTYVCGRSETTTTTAIITTDGCVVDSSVNLVVTYGPSYPLAPPIVYPQATATCASNPVCSMLGVRTGNCCPDDQGVFATCCSFCAAKSNCTVYASSNTTMCCPGSTNRWNPCCGPRP
jgi:hypothetical protein